MKRFEGQFTQQEPIDESAIEAALRVLRSGRLHRYNLLGNEIGEVTLLEEEYAKWQRVKYCLAVTSGGQAMQIALRAAGVLNGDQVLTNAFTLAPVPGAIHAVGAKPLFVEIDENLRFDIDDFQQKAERTGARFLLLSHMRGHLCDLERLVDVCSQFGILMIEDCAHTMGATWNGARSGNFGLAGCFSTQTYKHMNSGEGGFLTSNNPEFMARAIIMSGSYMLFERHGARPDDLYFERAKLEMPNCSARMDSLRASILRPQLANIEKVIVDWNVRYDLISQTLSLVNGVQLPQRPNHEKYVGSSIQFRIPEFSDSKCKAFLAACDKRGVELKWFGRKAPHGFTSNHKTWQYVAKQDLPQTDQTLRTLFDMRISTVFSLEDCEFIASLIIEAYREISKT